MKVYRRAAHVPHGWYKLDSPKSPLPWCPAEAVEIYEAEKAGFKPGRRGQEFVGVKSSFATGFRGISSRVYVSVWSR